MNTANKLTIFRVLLIPLILWLMYSDFAWSANAALAVFILATITDWLDGYIARRKNQITTFGKFMDPLADKLLVTAVLIAFVELGYLNGIPAIIIISREIIVTGFRLVAAGANKIIAASKLGKVKTVFQITAITAILIMNSPILSIIGQNALAVLTFTVGTLWLIWLMVAVTVVSGIDYIWKNRALLKVGVTK